MTRCPLAGLCVAIPQVYREVAQVLLHMVCKPQSTRNDPIQEQKYENAIQKDLPAVLPADGVLKRNIRGYDDLEEL